MGVGVRMNEEHALNDIAKNGGVGEQPSAHYLERVNGLHNIVSECIKVSQAYAGISVRYIGRIERYNASPTIIVVGRLADALGIEPGDLKRRAPKTRGRT
jgi:hypothetical protein